MTNQRLFRLNEQFLREITGILRNDVRDPRVRGVVVTSVTVTQDLWLARVYVRTNHGDKEVSEAMKGLKAASSFIRGKLGSRLHIRRIPELRFFEDEILDQANRIEEILRDIEKEKYSESLDEKAQIDNSED